MKRTVLYEKHVELNARMTEFSGWDMPLQYTRIMDEHMAVRRSAGIFDVSHMGDVVLEGKDVNSFVDYMFPTRASSIEQGKCLYTAFLDDNGCIMDDTIIYRLDDNKFFFVPNAGPTEEIVQWINDHRKGFDINIRNVSDHMASIALQGPGSEGVLKKMGLRLPDPFTFYETDLEYGNKITGKKGMIVSGTGYTGEKGVEFILPVQGAVNLWDRLMKLLSEIDGLPCGLGARDTLRMEKGMLLSGHDFNRNRTPYECSISFIMNEDHDFIGKEKVMENKEKSHLRFRGFVLEEKGIPREECSINIDGEKVGEITSGTLSPVLNKGIGLGFIDKKFMKSGTEVFIEIRGKNFKSTVTRPKIVP